MFDYSSTFSLSVSSPLTQGTRISQKTNLVLLSLVFASPCMLPHSRTHTQLPPFLKSPSHSSFLAHITLGKGGGGPLSHFQRQQKLWSSYTCWVDRVISCTDVVLRQYHSILCTQGAGYPAHTVPTNYNVSSNLH
jgi:hypothetical protein